MSTAVEQWSWNLPEQHLGEAIKKVKRSRTPRAAESPALLGSMALVIAATAFWALTLNNSVFIDESVYITAGRAYLSHWLTGVALPPDIGEGFSGSPMLYPVLAGALDWLGGLELVREFSLLCVLGTMLLVRKLTAHWFNTRAGLVAAAAFGFTAPVIYVGHLGTFDAFVVLLLAAALYVGVTRSSVTSGVVVSLLLATAIVTKYTAYALAPSVLVISLFSNYHLSRSTTLSQWVHDGFTDVARVKRAAVALLVLVSVISAAVASMSTTARASLAFTTTQRHALSPAPVDYLIGLIPTYVLPIGVLALVGSLWLALAGRWTGVLLAVGLVLTALALPAGQLILGEAVSFEKHLAYSALFLAPLAGWGLARPWKLSIWTPPLTFVLLITLMWGAFRSHNLIQYPDVRPVVTTLTDARAGVYLSSSADSLRYYTRDNKNIVWQTTFSLYGDGTSPEIEKAVTEGRYQEIVIHAGPTGSTIQDAGQARLLKALDNGVNYERSSVGKGEWIVFKNMNWGDR